VGQREVVISQGLERQLRAGSLNPLVLEIHGAPSLLNSAS
jgi:hypothetical protein